LLLVSFKLQLTREGEFSVLLLARYEVLRQQHQHSFNELFQGNPVSRHQKGEPFWLLMNQKMMRWQWHPILLHQNPKW